MAQLLICDPCYTLEPPVIRPGTPVVITVNGPRRHQRRLALCDEHLEALPLGDRTNGHGPAPARRGKGQYRTTYRCAEHDWTGHNANDHLLRHHPEVEKSGPKRKAFLATLREAAKAGG